MPIFIQTDSDETFIEAMRIAQGNERQFLPLGDEEVDGIVDDVVGKYRARIDDKASGNIEQEIADNVQAANFHMGQAEMLAGALGAAVNRTSEQNSPKVASTHTLSRYVKLVSETDPQETDNILEKMQGTLGMPGFEDRQDAFNRMNNFNEAVVNGEFNSPTTTPAQELEVIGSVAAVSAARCFAHLGHQWDE